MEYYILIDDTQRGPYSPADIQHMLTTELITMQSSVWREGMEEWVPLNSIYDQLTAPTKDRKTRDYFVLLNGDQQGPFSIEQLKQMYASGAITKNVSVWYDGLGDWRTIESMENSLFQPAQQQPKVSKILPNVSTSSELLEQQKRTNNLLFKLLLLFLVLFVVLPIIGWILLAIANINVSGITKSSEQASRLNNARQLTSAYNAYVEAYYAASNAYPATEDVGVALSSMATGQHVVNTRLGITNSFSVSDITVANTATNKLIMSNHYLVFTPDK